MSSFFESTRREFIVTSVALFSSKLMAKPSPLNDRIYTPFRNDKLNTYAVVMFDLYNNKLTSLSTNFFPHAISLSSINNLAVAPERDGPNIILFDKQKLNLIRHVNLKDIKLYGHAHFINNSIYCCYNDKVSSGLLELDNKLNIVNKHVTKEITSFHDMNINKNLILLPTGDKLYIFDSSKKHFSDHYNLDIKGNIGHSLYKNDHLYCAMIKLSKLGNSQYSRLGIINTLTMKSDIIDSDNLDIKYEILSLAVNNNNTLCLTTAPWDNTVHLWDLKNKKLQNKYQLDYPTGVSLSNDKRTFIVISSDGLTFINSNTGLKENHYNFKKEVRELVQPGKWKTNSFNHSV